MDVSPLIKVIESASIVIGASVAVISWSRKIYIKKIRPFFESVKEIIAQFTPSNGETLIDKVGELSSKMSDFDNHLQMLTKCFNSTLYLDPNPIFKSDNKGNYIFVNYAWLKLTGFTGQDEAFGNGWFKAIYHDDRDEVVKEWGNSIETESQFNMDYRYIHKVTKEITKVNTRTTIIRDHNHNPIQVIGLVQIIS